MSNSWLKFGCFLTGYKYRVLNHCSVASEKAVYKYTSAILLVCLIWGFIGYAFTSRYIVQERNIASENNLEETIGLAKKDTLDIINDTIKTKSLIETNHSYAKEGRSSLNLGAILVALIMIFVVIQIERQIILSLGKNKSAVVFRVIIGIIMSLIGSIIMDEMLFAKDINNETIKLVQAKVKESLPNEIEAIDEEIRELEKLDSIYRIEKDKILKEKPMVIEYENITNSTPVKVNYTNKHGQREDSLISYSTVSLIPHPIPNPNYTRIPGIESQLQNNQLYRDKLLDIKMNIRKHLTEYIRSNVGFIQEITALFKVLSNKESPYALFIWFLFLFFFLSIELFVLLIKIYDVKTDYEQIILYQMDVKIEQLKALKNTDTK